MKFPKAAEYPGTIEPSSSTTTMGTPQVLRAPTNPGTPPTRRGIMGIHETTWGRLKNSKILINQL